MYDQTTRINAAIAYFFMGPLMLLARNNGPFSHPFVRMHAKRSSLYMLIFLVIFLIFHFSQEYFLGISFLGISLTQVFLFCFNIIFFGFLLFSGYRAFHGDVSGDMLHLKEITEENILTAGQYSEEQKFQIIASFLMIFGIFSSQKSSLKEVIIGRKVSNFFLFLILFFAAITHSFITFPVIFCMLVYVGIFVSTSVFLMVQSYFLLLPFYKYIPTYHELEARIFATFSLLKEFFRVAFGKEKTTTFAVEYQKFLEKYSQKISFEEKFWTSPVLIGLPILNIITLPSFFQNKYHEYQGNIAEGFLLTIFTILLYFFAGNIFWLYLLIFPIATLIAEGKNNSNIRAPFTSIARNIFIFAYKTKQKINTLQESKTEEVIVINNTKTTETPEKPEQETEQKTEKNLEDMIKNI